MKTTVILNGTPVPFFKFYNHGGFSRSNEYNSWTDKSIKIGKEFYQLEKCGIVYSESQPVEVTIIIGDNH